MKEVEKFVYEMYKLDSIGSVDEARAILFSKKGKPKAVPPTSDAFHYMESVSTIRQLHGNKVTAESLIFQILKL